MKWPHAVATPRRSRSRHRGVRRASSPALRPREQPLRPAPRDMAGAAAGRGEGTCPRRRDGAPGLRSEPSPALPGLRGRQGMEPEPGFPDSRRGAGVPATYLLLTVCL